MTVLLTRGSEGIVGLLALSGHLNGPVNRKASVWVGGMMTFWRSETCLKDSTFQNRGRVRRDRVEALARA